MSSRQIFQCLSRIRIAFITHFLKRKFKMWIIPDGSSNNFNTLSVCRSPVQLVGRMSGRHEKYLIQAKLCIGIFPQDQMTDVNGIKSAPHDSHFFHFRHSCFFFSPGR